MIPEKKIAEFRELLQYSARPLIFFDDDPDGLSSFLQCYHLNPESNGFVFKAAGQLDEQFLGKVEEIKPDKVFVLDIPKLEQSFVDGCPDVIWLDHHPVKKLNGVKIFNPLIEDEKDNRPTSYWAYKINPDHLWICMVGCVGDWYLPPDLHKEFADQYPELLPLTVSQPDEALFTTPIGTLARVFSFCLKGNTKRVKSCINTLSRIKDPYEILNQSTSQGKYIWKKYMAIEKEYQKIKNLVQPSDRKLLLFRYDDDHMSLTSDLSNEMLFLHPKKFIIIAREKNGEMKCSLRSKTIPVRPILEKALLGIQGYGGGHEYACGCCIQKGDFDRFIESIEEQLK